MSEAKSRFGRGSDRVIIVRVERLLGGLKEGEVGTVKGKANWVFLKLAVRSFIKGNLC
jgi:hypothetical protein